MVIHLSVNTAPPFDDFAVGDAKENEMELRRQMIDQESQRLVDRRLRDQVIIVEVESRLNRHAIGRVDESGQNRFIVRGQTA